MVKILNEKRVGSITVYEDTILLGEIMGDVILYSGYLEVKGKILGNLMVHSGSCRHTGIIKGNLVNEKGDVEVFGAVYGKIITKHGYTYVNPGAKVSVVM